MRPLCVALAFAAVPCAAVAQAGESTGAAGLASQASGGTPLLSSRLLLRGDLWTMGSIGRDAIEEGVSHGSSLRSDRVTFLMDWFVHGGVRVTGGLTFSRLRADLRAAGGGGSIVLGNAALPIVVGDPVDSALRWPITMPYLGVGIGLPLGTGSGLLFDVGASFGKVSLSEPRNGPLLGSGSQAELDRQLTQLRDGLTSYRLVPQVSLGVNLRF